MNTREALTLLVQDQGKVTENMQTKILVLRHVVATSGQYHEGRSKVKILEPKSFDGARSAKELENFLRDMEYYFSTTRVVEIDKLNITKISDGPPFGPSLSPSGSNVLDNANSQDGGPSQI
ncbi:hypothetical protein BC332_03562 [Capsicum chinense]|nr:hypothetical protein BC332_03562 [Capsicum chinense]